MHFASLMMIVSEHEVAADQIPVVVAECDRMAHERPALDAAMLKRLEQIDKGEDAKKLAADPTSLRAQLVHRDSFFIHDDNSPTSNGSKH
jgi:hypothetical protein